MTLLTTTDMDGDTLNLGDHVEVDATTHDYCGHSGEIVRIFKNSKMRIKPDCEYDPAFVALPAEVALIYRGDS